MNTMTKANSKAWNTVAKTHYENYHVDKLLAGEPLLHELIQAEVGDVRGKSLIYLLCHIGTDTLSWGLLGAQVTGVDISPESIKYCIGQRHFEHLRLLPRQRRIVSGFSRLSEFNREIVPLSSVV